MSFFEHKVVAVDDVIPYAMNSRSHSEEQVAQIAAAIREFGFTNPLLVDPDMNLIAGHGRLMAARKLKLNDIPVIVVTGLDDRKRRALIISDNKIALNSSWDEEKLAVELEDLAAEYGELMGFSEADLAKLAVTKVGEGLTDEDQVPEAPVQPVTVLGDIWTLGRHRLLCGDSTSIDAVDLVLDGIKPNAIFTDPPYGLGLDKEGQKLGKSKAYGAVLNDHDSQVAKDAFALAVSMKIPEMYFWGANHYSSCLPDSSCWIVWDKQGGKSVTYADCELCYTNIDKPVRMFTHIWDGFRRDSEKGEIRVHPNQKPIKLFTEIWEKFNMGQVVLDLFGGSGSTLLAAEITNRNCHMIELNEPYCDVIITRWQDFTGQKAVHEASGKTFDEMKADRLGGNAEAA